MVARQGLTIDVADPVQPGETRTVRITARDALWASEGLAGLIQDADSRLGGLLFLFDAAGNRHVASISSAVIPKFD
jgi:methane/ammonia monooxygenase subunit B